MVGYECYNCGGDGYENVVKHDKSMKLYTVRAKCKYCFGAGLFTNGKPDVDWDCGITDLTENWKVKWGDNYEEEVLKGLRSRGIL